MYTANQNYLQTPIDWKRMQIAYFCMEIGIDPKMPTYAGGLGILAGDTLRSAADFELPMVGVTLLHRKGYCSQKIDEEGNQIEQDINWQPADFLVPLPQQVRVKVENRDVWIKAWMARMIGISGHINPILFLDTDLEQNSEQDRALTYFLYGGDMRYRIAQEIILGIGGIRMLDALGATNIRKFHMNEGHSTLLILELLNKAKNSNEEEVIRRIRRKCVFTTHTPIGAGQDQIERNFAEQMLGDQLPKRFVKDIFVDNMLNLTYLGLRFSEFINGVAKEHGKTTKHLFPGYEIDAITNGIHSRYWTSSHFHILYQRYFPGWERDPYSLRYALSIPSDSIWEAHQKAKADLISFANNRYQVGMNTETFTIGFARRATAYKRGDMLFKDIQRLRHVSRKTGGIQIVYAGKAHPQDFEGKDLIKRIINAMKELSSDIRSCYIEDYGIDTAKLLVAGVDLWLNTPVAPQEASGTSGMKAAHNGVPQLSVLGGWWLEGHIENITGWSIGQHPSDQQQSMEEDIDDMYTKLEYVIIPKFYNERDDWIRIMRHAIAINGSFFNTHRMLQQYVLDAYFR